jgi:hypothetical protein
MANRIVPPETSPPKTIASHSSWSQEVTVVTA